MASETSAAALAVLERRGFVAQQTDRAALLAAMAAGPTPVYTGYDPTAASLHVGHLVTLMALRHLQAAGHPLVLLVGDGTAQVGDPSGRSALRPMLSAAQIGLHAAALRAQLERFFAPAVGAPVHCVHNGDWLGGLGYISFLRDIGRHFSVNRMLAAETYKQRLAQGLSFIEFNYQLLQAYDFLQLRRSHAVRLQVGGDDQWSNILAGVELNRRVDGETVFGLTLPLLTTADGQKMGKTQAGALWLDPQRVSPAHYFQYFVNVADADVLRLLRLFTFLPEDQIDAVAGLRGTDCNALKTILAYETTCVVHGRAAALDALAQQRATFAARPLPAELLPASDLPRAPGGAAPAAADLVLQAAELAAGLGLLELLVRAGLAASKAAARRLVVQGGVRWETQPLTDPQVQVAKDWFVQPSMLLWAGKKRAVRVALK